VYSDCFQVNDDAVINALLYTDNMYLYLIQQVSFRVHYTLYTTIQNSLD
jgi:hypothetical protein